MSDPAPTSYPVLIGDGGSTATTEGLPALVVGEAADSIVDWGLVGSLHVRAATTRGRMHRFDETPRQDAFHLGVVPDRALVLAVADGVSAAPRSHVASGAVVRLATDRVTAELAGGGEDDPIDWTACVAAARERVLALARESVGDQAMTARDASDTMATTLTVAVVDLAAGDDGTRRVRVMSFGDVGAWLLRSGATWESVTPIKNEGSAIAESAVAALPLEYGGTIVEHEGRLGPGDAFFLLSDGIGDPLGAGTGVVGKALAAAWATVPGPYDFAGWVDFARRTHTDDRTAIGVWPAG